MLVLPMDVDWQLASFREAHLTAGEVRAGGVGVAVTGGLTLGGEGGSRQLTSVRDAHSRFIAGAQHSRRPPGRFEHPKPPHSPHFLSQQTLPSASMRPSKHMSCSAGFQQGRSFGREHWGAVRRMAFTQQWRLPPGKEEHPSPLQTPQCAGQQTLLSTSAMPPSGQWDVAAFVAGCELPCCDCWKDFKVPSVIDPVATELGILPPARILDSCTLMLALWGDCLTDS